MNTAVREVQADEVRDLAALLGALVRELEPSAVPLDASIGMFMAFDEVRRLAEAGTILMARRVERTATWRAAGFRSAAEQLAHLSGTSVVAARGQLVTSKQLEDLPYTAHALRIGELSAGKAEFIADAATVIGDTEVELELLDGAEHKPLSQVRDECLRAKRNATDPERTHRRIRSVRRLTQHTDAEGAWRFHGRGTSDARAEFRAAHEPILDELYRAARAAGECERREAYAFDALIEMARRLNNGIPTSHDNAARPVAGYKGIIRADLDALRRGWIEGEEECEIVGIGPIPVRVTRELLGNAILKLVITKGVDVANVTHLGRSVTVAQQVALWWQSPTCANEGCNRTQHLENDHREDWVKTKHTRLDESDPLCGHEHRLKTRRGWALVPGKGKRAFVPPDDPRHPKYRPPQRE